MTTQFKVVKNIVAGGVFWQPGLYPTHEGQDMSCLERVMKFEEKQGIQPRSVIGYRKDELEASTAGEAEVESTVEETVDAPEKSGEKAVSKEEFETLNATKQKQYVKQIVDTLDDDTLYAALSEYQEVATAPSVVTAIQEALSEFE